MFFFSEAYYLLFPLSLSLRGGEVPYFKARERGVISFVKQTEICRPWPALLCHSLTCQEPTIIFFLIGEETADSANCTLLIFKNNHAIVPSIVTVT